MDEVSMSAVELDAVESGALSPAGRIHESPDNPEDPGLVQGADPLLEVGAPPGGCSHHRHPRDFFPGLAAGMGQLTDEGDLRGGCLGCRHHLGPGLGLPVRVHSALARVHGPTILGNRHEPGDNGPHPSSTQGGVQVAQLIHLRHPSHLGHPFIGGRSDDPVGQGQRSRRQGPEEGGTGDTWSTS